MSTDRKDDFVDADVRRSKRERVCRRGGIVELIAVAERESVREIRILRPVIEIAAR